MYYLLKINVRNIADLIIVKNLPGFYKEVFCSFNECKTITPLNKLNSDVFLQQVIWNNVYFTTKGRPLMFRNWLDSNVYYVKDLYDNDGNFHNIEHFSNIIRNKSNWLCEYKVLKHIFSSLSKRFDCTKGKYINIVNKKFFLFSHEYQNIYDKKSRFFYDAMLHKKFQKPCYQNILTREFSIADINSWHQIYKNKVKNIQDKNIAEFNYKLLNNLLCTNFYLGKWKQGVSMYCKLCLDRVEYIKHLLYECSNVKTIWYVLGTILNFEVKWKHIVLGFYHCESEYTMFLNLLISFTACRIYKHKMFCRLESLDENMSNIRIEVKHSLNNLYRIFVYKGYKYADLIKNVMELL